MQNHATRGGDPPVQVVSSASGTTYETVRAIPVARSAGPNFINGAKIAKSLRRSWAVCRGQSNDAA